MSSLRFTQKVPDQSPLVFAAVQSGDAEVFLNAPEPAIAEYPAFKSRPIGGTLTLFMEVEGISELHGALAGRVSVVMPLERSVRRHGVRHHRS
jgi:hypothetical protein